MHSIVGYIPGLGFAIFGFVVVGMVFNALCVVDVMRHPRLDLGEKTKWIIILFLCPIIGFIAYRNSDAGAPVNPYRDESADEDHIGDCVAPAEDVERRPN